MKPISFLLVFFLTIGIANASITDDIRFFIQSVLPKQESLISTTTPSRVEDIKKSILDIGNSLLPTSTKSVNDTQKPLPINDIQPKGVESNPFKGGGVNINQDSKQTNNQKVDTNVKIDDIKVRFTNIDELVSQLTKSIAGAVGTQIEALKQLVGVFSLRLDLSDKRLNDISERQQSLEKLQTTLSSSQAELSKTAETIKEVSKTNAGVLSSVNSQASQSGSNLSNLITDIQTLKNNVSTLSTTANNITNLQTNFATLSNRFDALINPTITTSSVESILNSNSTISGLQDQIIALNTTLGMSTTTIQSIGESITTLQGLQPQIETLAQNLANTTSSILNLISDNDLNTKISSSSVIIGLLESINNLSTTIMSYDPNSSGAVLTPIIHRFTASGTYTKTAGISHAIIEIQGGGASGGGSPSTNALQRGGSTGGAGGGYVRFMLTDAQLTSTVAITVGAGGAVSTSGGNGNAGGNSSFGAYATATGGGAGDSGAVGGTGAANGATGGTGSVTTGTLLQAVQGGSTASIAWNANFQQAGAGGNSYWGIAPQLRINDTVVMSSLAGVGFGSGSSGVGSPASSGIQNSVAGRIGLVVITEYFQ